LLLRALIAHVIGRLVTRRLIVFVVEKKLLELSESAGVCQMRSEYPPRTSFSGLRAKESQSVSLKSDGNNNSTISEATTEQPFRLELVT